MNTEIIEILKADPLLQGLMDATHPLREEARNHRLFGRIATLPDLQSFMEHHAFAVWDFMSLAKALQGSLTCVTVPWVPRGERLARRLINEVVLDEESDEDGAGGYVSHFELYLEAMRQCGARTEAVEAFVARVSSGEAVTAALTAAPAPAARFVAATWDVLAARQPHRTAAVFTLAREEIIPEMFYALVWNVQERFPGRLTRLVYYLERHINVDKDKHSPMALRMLQELCGRDPKRWDEAAESARACLRARLRLWDDVAALLPGAA